jgi:uncharacterized protein
MRHAISSNRIYAWMIVFILVIQALSVFARINRAESRKDALYARQEFKAEIDRRQEALSQLLKQDKHLAYNFGIIFMLALCVMLTGTVFLSYYVKNRLQNKTGLPRTLNTPQALWSAGDVFKAVVFFVFFHRFFSLASCAVQFISKADIADFRLNAAFSTLAMNFLLFLFILRVVKVKYRQGVDSLGLSLKNFALNIRAGLYFYIAFLPVLAVVLLSVFALARIFDYTPPPQPVYELIFKEQRPVELIMASFLIAMAGPFVEEVFFRGFLYSAFRKTIGVMWAILFSSFLFAFLHMSLLGFIPIMLLGILLAYLRERTGSLMPSVAVHVVHNGVLAAMMFYIRELTAKAL